MQWHDVTRKILGGQWPTFRAGSKRREIIRPAFPISLHLVISET